MLAEVLGCLHTLALDEQVDEYKVLFALAMQSSTVQARSVLNDAAHLIQSS
jgi:hypothetical protein